MSEHKTDIVAEKVSLLPDSGRRVVDLVSIVEAFSAEFQEIEDVAWQMFVARRLENAVGVQLDVLGAILGQSRNDYGDDDYRDQLKARILANASSGSIAEVLAILRLVVPISTTLVLTEWPPAGFVVEVGVDDLGTKLLELVASFLRTARAGGIRAILHYMSGVDETTAFTFDGGAGYGGGWGDKTDATVGGGWAGAID
jgi:hypothetical protein